MSVVRIFYKTQDCEDYESRFQSCRSVGDLLHEKYDVKCFVLGAVLSPYGPGGLTPLGIVATMQDGDGLSNTLEEYISLVGMPSYVLRTSDYKAAEKALKPLGMKLRRRPFFNPAGKEIVPM